MKIFSRQRKMKQVKYYRHATDVKVYDHQVTPRGSPNTSLEITVVCSSY